MNKKILILAAAAFGLTFASCKKDYTCTCTQTLNGQPFQTVTMNIENSSKGDAKDKCPEGATTASSGGFTVSQSCALND